VDPLALDLIDAEALPLEDVPLALVDTQHPQAQPLPPTLCPAGLAALQGELGSALAAEATAARMSCDEGTVRGDESPTGESSGDGSAAGVASTGPLGLKLRKSPSLVALASLVANAAGFQLGRARCEDDAEAAAC